jgi:putative ABC transport system substrate-binding protein
MRRREIVAALGGAAAWPVRSWAQHGPARRLGVLLVYGEEHPHAPLAVRTLKDALQRLGWTEGQNLAIDLRYARGQPELVRRYTDEILAPKPDVVFAQGVVGAAAMQRATNSVPVVFIQVQDPVGGGFVSSLSRPGANLTGFTNFEYSFVGKWLQLLKELSPGTTRALAIINPDNRARFAGYSAALERIAPGLGIHATAGGVQDGPEIERALASLAETPNGGLIVLPDATTGLHGKLIVDLAARLGLPAIFAYSAQVRIGGLAAYTNSVAEDAQRAAGYIDRLLRGAKVSDLPVQASERFETVINLKTAAALGLTISPSLLARADEVID